jgi:hydroxymethylpyrimidine kinase / phosphomethylpyrimidine kinase / thiamine-phosphate diphosphorylase
MRGPVVWSIAGSDSGGGAGIQADLHAFHALGVHGCSVITAITAQSSIEVSAIEEVSPNLVSEQLKVMWLDLTPSAVKIGMLFSKKIMRVVEEWLFQYQGAVICDPVMVSTSGDELLQSDAKHFLIGHIFSKTHLLTPNLLEAEVILGRSLHTPEAIEEAAEELLSLGLKAVLIKGGSGEGKYCHDYFSNGKTSVWLSNYRISPENNHGSGCSLSSAIAAYVGKGMRILDAVVLAKAYVTQGIRMAKQYGQGPGPLAHDYCRFDSQDLPWLSASVVDAQRHFNFPRCGDMPLGLYPVVDSASWVKRLGGQGVSTIQLRVKDMQGVALEKEITGAIAAAKGLGVRLFINDYWQLAIEHGAYGVHLGQSDLLTADMVAIEKAGLRVGISTHCEEEVGRALAYTPSYIAVGPIFETTSKEMPFLPQGLRRLTFWCQYLDCPVVAIGGINQSNVASVVEAGADGIAMIAGVVQQKDPEAAVKSLVHSIEVGVC